MLDKEGIKKSQEIVVQILVIMREKKITQKELAELMDVVPQRVQTILRGDENLTMETVAKLEKALQTKIIDVVKTADNACETVSVVKELKKPVASKENAFNKKAEVTQRTEYNQNEDGGFSLAA